MAAGCVVGKLPSGGYPLPPPPPPGSGGRGSSGLALWLIILIALLAVLLPCCCALALFMRRRKVSGSKQRCRAPFSCLPLSCLSIAWEGERDKAALPGRVFSPL